MKIVVSLVSYNTKDLLDKCLGNIFSQTTSHQIDVWVIDNNSQDESALMVKNKYKEVNFIANTSNEGFAKAHNLIAKKTKYDLFVMLNPDTILENTTIDKMAQFMVDNPGCGVSSCRLVGVDGRLQSNGGDLPFNLSLFSWLFNLEFIGIKPNLHRQDKEYYALTRGVGWVGGTLMAVRPEVFNKIGYMNEDFFMYFEDVEFCFRAHQAGYKIMINPEVTIQHIGGASSKDPRLNQWQGEFKGLVYFYTKLYGAFGLIFIKVLIYISVLLRMIAFSIVGNNKVAKTYGKILLAI